MSSELEAFCYDCQRTYGEAGFPDLLIPDWAWNRISPTGNSGGLLCPSCICARLEQEGIKSCPSAFTSGPLAFQVRDWIRKPQIK